MLYWTTTCTSTIFRSPVIIRASVGMGVTAASSLLRKPSSMRRVPVTSTTSFLPIGPGHHQCRPSSQSSFQADEGHWVGTWFSVLIGKLSLDGAMSSLEKCAAASFPVLSTIFEIHSRVGIILPGPRERRGLNSFGNDYSKPAYKQLSPQFKKLRLVLLLRAINR